MSLSGQDTIVALSTPPGRGAIGIVRLSGPESLTILRQLVADEAFDPAPAVMTLRTLFEPGTVRPLDQAMVCYFKAPHSFTGEDVVELHCHGSPVLMRAVIDTALTLGARLAQAGEFSLRSVANGRMQLAEAEAIRDLIDAHTDSALRQATRQLKGEISSTLQPVKDQLIRIIVRLESSLEFVEDDLPMIEQRALADSLSALREALTQLADTFARGRMLRDGLSVTLVGRPNVGKSSLFNSLLGLPRAIVTALPGTTRDTISESVSIDGVPILLTDTAGLRDSSDQIEAIGVDRTKRHAADADLIVIVIDGAAELTEEDRQVFEEFSDRQYLVVLNKSDLAGFCAEKFNPPGRANGNRHEIVSVAATTGAGIDQLRSAIISPFAGGHLNGEGLLITNARHHHLLRQALEAIGSSEELLRAQASEELLVVGLHNSLKYLGEITGETTSDEILGQIFSTFCIGK